MGLTTRHARITRASSDEWVEKSLHSAKARKAKLFKKKYAIRGRVDAPVTCLNELDSVTAIAAAGFVKPGPPPSVSHHSCARRCCRMNCVTHHVFMLMLAFHHGDPTWKNRLCMVSRTNVRNKAHAVGDGIVRLFVTRHAQTDTNSQGAQTKLPHFASFFFFFLPISTQLFLRPFGNGYMVRKGLHMHGDIELTRHRTSEYYDDVLGAKIKSLVYACHLTMAFPSA
jgi:hypothetical protein